MDPAIRCLLRLFAMPQNQICLRDVCQVGWLSRVELDRLGEMTQRFVPATQSSLEQRACSKDLSAVRQQTGGSLQLFQGTIVISISVVMKKSLRQMSFAGVGGKTPGC